MNSPIFNESDHRRSFLNGVGAATAGLMLANPLGAAETNAPAAAPGDAGIPRRTSGKTGEQVSIIGIGG